MRKALRSGRLSFWSFVQSVRDNGVEIGLAGGDDGHHPLIAIILAPSIKACMTAISAFIMPSLSIGI